MVSVLRQLGGWVRALRGGRRQMSEAFDAGREIAPWQAPEVAMGVVGTGLGRWQGHRICEIGFVALGDAAAEFKMEWSSLVNPGRAIERAVTGKSGIAGAMVSGAPRMVEIAGLVWSLVEKARVVVYDEEEVDLLRGELGPLGYPVGALEAFSVKRLARESTDRKPCDLATMGERLGLVDVGRLEAERALWRASLVGCVYAVLMSSGLSEGASTDPFGRCPACDRPMKRESEGWIVCKNIAAPVYARCNVRLRWRDGAASMMCAGCGEPLYVVSVPGRPAFMGCSQRCKGGRARAA